MGNKLKKEDFGCMYRIREYFSEMDRQIEKFDDGKGENSAVEKLKKTREGLFWTVRELNRTDLQILYYLHSLEQIKAHQLLSALKKLYAAQGELFAIWKE